VTDEGREPLFTRKHVRTGQPRGGRPGNTNAFKHGRRSRAHVEGRKALNALLRRCKQALSQLE
jgi:hypothetical protein